MSMNTRRAVKQLERRRAHLECLIEEDEFFSEEQKNWVRGESAALKVLLALGRAKMEEEREQSNGGAAAKEAS